jgi:hypothetical protein
MTGIEVRIVEMARYVGGTTRRPCPEDPRESIMLCLTVLPRAA